MEREREREGGGEGGQRENVTEIMTTYLSYDDNNQLFTNMFVYVHGICMRPINHHPKQYTSNVSMTVPLKIENTIKTINPQTHNFPQPSDLSATVLSPSPDSKQN